jgi:hypothetical protein
LNSPASLSTGCARSTTCTGGWYAERKIGGLIYICGDADCAERIRKTAAERSLFTRKKNVRIDVLDPIIAEANDACDVRRAERMSQAEA